jgi:hypothetical protein
VAPLLFLEAKPIEEDEELKAAIVTLKKEGLAPKKKKQKCKSKKKNKRRGNKWTMTPMIQIPCCLL